MRSVSEPPLPRPRHAGDQPTADWSPPPPPYPPLYPAPGNPYQPQYPPQPAQKPPAKKSHLWLYVIGGVASLLVIGAVTGNTNKSSSSSAIPNVGSRATAPAAPAAASGPATTIEDGTHVVGVDIQPGTYRTAGAASINCYWARLRSTDGDFNAIIANGNTEGKTTVTIKATDKAFESNGCQTWTGSG